MSLEITINDHLKKAMLAKDEKGLRALRAIKAAILLAKTAEGAGDAMTTDAEIKLLQKLVKQRKDSIEIFEQQNRADLAVKEKEEVEVIEQYLPTQMSADEIKLAVAEIIKLFQCNAVGLAIFRHGGGVPQRICEDGEQMVSFYILPFGVDSSNHCRSHHRKTNGEISPDFDAWIGQ